MEGGRRGVFHGASEGGEWLSLCGVAAGGWRLGAGGDAGNSTMMAERGGEDGEPASKRRTRSMTRRARLEQSARALCVLMRWKLHLQGNVLDEIVGSIEDGGC